LFPPVFETSRNGLDERKRPRFIGRKHFRKKRVGGGKKKGWVVPFTKTS